MVDPHEAVPFIGRLGELDAATRALLSEGHGVVVHGAPGSGTTAFAHRVVDSLGPDVVALHLRGSAAAAEVPYGAIMPILRDGDPHSLAHPLQALRTAVDHVARAGGARVVLVVHGAQFVDPMSALVLSSLSARRECTLLLVADSVRALPADLAALAREGALARVEVRPFTVEETAQYAAARFGRPVAPLLARMLWKASGGRARSLAALVDMLRTEPDPVGLLHRWRVGQVPPLRTALPTALAWLSAPERALVDVLALAGSLPLGLVQKVTDPPVLDAVLASRLVALDVEPGQPLHVADPVVAAALRGLVGVGRRHSLLRVAFPDGEPEDPAVALAYGRWAASCGTPVTPGFAAVAAQAAMDDGDPESALAVIDAAGPVRVPALEVLRAVALALLGRAATASAVLAGVALADDDALAELAVTWALTTVPDLVVGEGPERLAVGVVLRSVVPLAWRGLPSAEVVAACVALADGDAAGAFAPLLAEAQRVQDEPSRWRDAVTWRAREAAAVTGARLPDPLAALAAQAAAPVGSTRDGRTQGSLSGLLLDLLGDRPHPTVAGAGELEPGREPEDAATRDLALGLEALRSARPGDAAAILGPLATVVRLMEQAGALRVVLAAWALAAASEGDVVSARATLDAVRAAPVPRRWLPGRVAEILMAQAGVALRDDGAVRALAALGAEERAGGRPLLAAHALIGAVLAGSSDALTDLEGAAGALPGWVGDLGRRLAAGIAQGDAADLGNLVEDAERRGSLETALQLAGAAARVARAGADAELLRRAQAAEARLAARSTRGHQRRGGAVHRLTPREQEIARLILRGAGNQRVAEMLHLSVRTVEGHLSRIYTKLAVGGRDELTALLG